MSPANNELVGTVLSAIGQTNISELPNLVDMLATIGELSATMTEISSSVPLSSTVDSPSIGELLAIIQELSATILVMSANSGVSELTADVVDQGSEAVSSKSQAVQDFKQFFILPVSQVCWLKMLRSGQASISLETT